MSDPAAKSATVTEESEVDGNKLVDHVKGLIEKGNIRQIKITAKDGDQLLEVPLSLGLIAGSAIALTAPWLAVLGVVAALVGRARIEVERDASKETEPNKDAA
jgi:hypothetical protein